MTAGLLHLFPRHQQLHLRLAAAVTPGTRRPVRRRPGPPEHADRTEHGRVVREQLDLLVARHAARSPVLGVRPELVLVLELNRALNPEIVNRAGITLLE